MSRRGFVGARAGKVSSVCRLMSVPIPVDTEPSGVLPGSNRCRFGPLPCPRPCAAVTPQRTAGAVSGKGMYNEVYTHRNCADNLRSCMCWRHTTSAYASAEHEQARSLFQ